jgi:hypothetical protein
MIVFISEREVVIVIRLCGTPLLFSLEQAKSFVRSVHVVELVHVNPRHDFLVNGVVRFRFGRIVRGNACRKALPVNVWIGNFRELLTAKDDLHQLNEFGFVERPFVNVIKDSVIKAHFTHPVQRQAVAVEVVGEKGGRERKCEPKQ